MKPRFEVGALGWDDGHALQLVECLQGERFRAWVCKVGAPDGNWWYEAHLEKELRKKLGPDCDGALPTRAWFKKMLREKE
jgi:hypothetical protein